MKEVWKVDKEAAHREIIKSYKSHCYLWPFDIISLVFFLPPVSIMQANEPISTFRLKSFFFSVFLKLLMRKAVKINNKSNWKIKEVLQLHARFCPFFIKLRVQWQRGKLKIENSTKLNFANHQRQLSDRKKAF